MRALIGVLFLTFLIQAPGILAADGSRFVLEGCGNMAWMSSRTFTRNLMNKARTLEEGMSRNAVVSVLGQPFEEKEIIDAGRVVRTTMWYDIHRKHNNKRDPACDTSIELQLDEKYFLRRVVFHPGKMQGITE